MHELSIAISVLDLAEAEAERHGGARVLAIHLKLGPLSGVVKEALLSAYGLAREGTSLSGCDLRIEEVPIVAYCPACRAERSVESAQMLCCAECGTPTPKILSGREMEITALEVCS
jgi:hydrogenase nickel incorporation protein HypA/HybF